MSAPPPPPTDHKITLADLAERERSVLALLAAGHTNKEIARELSLSKNIVDKILSSTSSHYSVYPKIGVENAKGAVAWYLHQTTRTETEMHANHVSAAPEATQATSDWAGPRDTDGARRAQAREPFLAVFLTLYIALVGLTFIPIWLQGETNTTLTQWGNAYAALPLIAGIYGLRQSRTQKPTFSPAIWRGLRWLSVGLIAWAAGTAVAVGYFLATQSAAPYPSLADVGYVAHDICLTAAYVLWLRNLDRRGERHRWLWLALATLTATIYLAVRYSLRNLGADFHDAPLLPFLDVIYVSLESLCVGIAITLLASKRRRAPLPLGLRFICSGVMLFFLAGVTFGLTANLPEGHALRFFSGNSVDLLFATAFLLVGIGIACIGQAPSSEPYAQAGVGWAKWAPALIGLAALVLAATPVIARGSARGEPNMSGAVQMVGQPDHRIRIEANGHILTADETLPAYTPARVVFQVLNNGAAPLALRALTIGVRGPGVTCRDKNTIRWAAPDVPFPTVDNLTLRPGEMYEYRGVRAFYLPGTYFLEPVAQDAAGHWGGIPPFTCVELTVVDRTPSRSD